MTTVHNIDVALRATTGEFDRDIMKSAGVTAKEFGAMRRAVDGAAPAVDRLHAAMASLNKLNDAGGFTGEQFEALSGGLKREIAAAEAGFSSFSDAIATVDRVLGVSQTKLEAYSADVMVLERALRIGAATEDQVAEAKRRHAAEADRVSRADREAAEDARVAALGFRDLADATSQATAVARRNETSTEAMAREIARLDRLLQTGELSMRDYRREVDRLNNEQRRAAGGGRSMAASVADQVPMLSRWSGIMAGAGPAGVAAAAGVAIFAAAGYVVGRAASSAADAIQEQLDQIDKLGKASAKLGLTADELVGLRHALGEGSGMEESAIDMALQRFTRRVAEAAIGTGEAKDALKDLGLDAVELSAMGAARGIEAVSEKMAGIDDAGDRLRLGMKLFDSEGAALVTALADGPEALRESVAWAEKWLGLTEQQVDQTETLNDTLGRVSGVVRGTARTFAAELAPAIQGVADDLLGVTDNMNKVAGSTSGIDVAALNTSFLASGAYGNAKDFALMFDGIQKLKAGLLTLDTGMMNAGIGQTWDATSFSNRENEIQRNLQAREDADGAAKLRERIEAGIAARKSQEASAARISEQFADPSDKLAETLAELGKLEVAGMLDPGPMERAALSAERAFASALSGVGDHLDLTGQVMAAAGEIQQAFDGLSIDPSGVDVMAEAMADTVRQRLEEQLGKVSPEAFGETLGTAVDQVTAAIESSGISGAVADRITSAIDVAAAELRKSDPALKEAEKAEEALDKSAEALRQAIQSPADVLADKLIQYQELFDAGKITAEERDLASGKAVEEAAKRDRPDGPSAAMRGSVAAFQAEIKTAQSEGKVALAEAKKQTGKLDKIDQSLQETRIAIEGLSLGEVV